MHASPAPTITCAADRPDQDRPSGEPMTMPQDGPSELPPHTARHAAGEPADPATPLTPPPPAEPPRDEGQDEPRGEGSSQGRGTTRRWFLAGSGIVVLAAGAGIGVGVAHRESPPRRRRPPAALVAAVAAERALIADLDATTGGSDAVREVLQQARADHAEHARTLATLVARYPQAQNRPTSTPPPSGRPRTVAQLRAAEQDAARLAGARADASDGTTAALFASIAACESVHAELLSESVADA